MFFEIFSMVVPKAYAAMPGDSGDDVDNMRFLIWNIRAGGGRRKELIRDAVVRLNPDVCAFSEFRETAPGLWLKEALYNLGYVSQRSANGAELPRQNIVFLASKFPLRIIRRKSDPNEPGRWLSVRLGGVRPIDFCLVHIPNEHAGRKDDYLDAVLRLADQLKGRDAIIAGDTNSGRPVLDEQNPVFDDRYTRWFDALENSGWQDAFRLVAGDRREYTWHSPQKDNGFRLDQAFVSTTLRYRVAGFRHEWVGARGAMRRDVVSDHAAMILDIAAGSPLSCGLP